MTLELPNEPALIADMQQAYPDLMCRPLREFGKNYAQMIGVWTGGPGDMPDGMPIFNSLEHGCDDEWDGHVHKGFSKWLEDRGWYVEAHDAETYLIIPIAYAEELS